MTLPLRVLGDRVLVKPDVLRNAPEQTASGVYVARSLAAAVTGEDPTSSLHRGTVMAVGRPAHPLQYEARVLADKLQRHMPVGDDLALDAAHTLRDLVRRDPCVQVGDDVLFSHDAGQEIRLEDETWLILREAELLAVVAPEGVSV